MKKLLIFDLDGTLADTLPSIRLAINMMLAELGYPQKSYDEVRLAIGDGARKLVERLLPDTVEKSEKAVSNALALYEKMYDTTYMEVGGCYDGMLETLAELKKRGYVIAVLSNKQDAYVKPIVKNITEKGIVSLTLGQRVGYPTKPNPTVPIQMAEELGYTPDRAVFIGDSEVDVKTAKNASMGSVGCSWGYRQRELLEDSGADFIIDFPEELLNIFE